MTDDDRLDLMLAYAADSLDEPEHRTIRARLAAGDPQLAGALAEAEGVLARFSGTVGPVTPGAGVRQRLMDRLPDRQPKPARNLSIPAAVRPGESRPGEALLADIRDRAQMQVSRPLGKSEIRTGSRRPVWPRLAAAAAVGALLVGGPAAYVAWESRTAAGAQAATVTSLKNRLAAEQAGARDLLGKLGSAEVKFATMSDPAPAGAARPRGRVMWDADGRQCHVWVFDLAPPPPGKVYQLWFLPGDGQKPIPAPTFMVDGSGKGEILAQLPPGLTTANTAVSEELAGGSKTPTVVKLVGNL
jgi:hypothetical protein